MWISGIGKMEDISRCFRYFDQFRKDFPALYDSDKGVIKRIAFDHYEWTKSETSLAEYFKWIGEEERKKIEKNQLNIPGGFWNPIATVFRKNQRRLSKLAGNNANPFKPKESKGFKEIRKIVEEYREKVKRQAEQERKDRETFTAIKTIIDETAGGDIKEIRTVLEKIKTALA